MYNKTDRPQIQKSQESSWNHKYYQSESEKNINQPKSLQNKTQTKLNGTGITTQTNKNKQTLVVITRSLRKLTHSKSKSYCSASKKDTVIQEQKRWEDGQSEPTRREWVITQSIEKLKMSVDSRTERHTDRATVRGLAMSQRKGSEVVRIKKGGCLQIEDIILKEPYFKEKAKTGSKLKIVKLKRI